MSQILRALAVVFAALAISSCETLPPIPVSEFMGRVDNACLPEAVLLAESFHQQGVTAKVLLVTTPTYNHAVVAFLYPSKKPELWVWDSNYWVIKVNASIDDPIAIAHLWLKANMLDDASVIASYLQQ